MQYSKLALKLKEQIHEFSGKLFPHFSLPLRRFVEQMIYGIQARQSVRLSEIARSLQEGIGLIKTETRLSRNLEAEGLDEQVIYGVGRLGSRRVHQDTLLILDPSDIAKQYAKKMEYLGKVRDGSTGEIKEGYFTCHVVACESEGERMVPLYQALYSSQAPDHESENKEILKAVECLTQVCQGRGIWVMDRGGDRGQLIGPFLDKRLRFIVRSRGDRHLDWKGRRVSAMELGMICPRLYEQRIVKVDRDGEEKMYHLRFGFMRVRLPKREEPLYLVVVHGLGEEPMILLTNLPLVKKREVVWFVVGSYLTRWRVEEAIRFIKQSYSLEDIRVLTYRRLKNLVALVLAASFFAAVYLGDRLKLAVLAKRVFQAAKRFFGIPAFRYYALADGIAAILKRSSTGPLCHPPTPSLLSTQPTLFHAP